MRTVTIVKQKDGEDGLRWRFDLERYVLGYDCRGNEVSTCLVRYLPEQGSAELDKVAQATADNDLFLACLRERTRQRRAVSEKHSPTYAPSEFVRMPESQKIGKARLEAAMERLFRIGIIDRGELWKDDHRKPVFGLREAAANGAGDTLRPTRATVPQGAEMRAANAGETYTSPKGEEGAASSRSAAPSGSADEGLDAADYPVGF